MKTSKKQPIKISTDDIKRTETIQQALEQLQEVIPSFVIIGTETTNIKDATELESYMNGNSPINLISSMLNINLATAFALLVGACEESPELADIVDKVATVRQLKMLNQNKIDTTESDLS